MNASIQICAAIPLQLSHDQTHSILSLDGLFRG